MTRKTIWHEFPLHDETQHIAQLCLPIDLTIEECERIYKVMLALATPSSFRPASEVLIDGFRIPGTCKFGDKSN